MSPHDFAECGLTTQTDKRTSRAPAGCGQDLEQTSSTMHSAMNIAELRTASARAERADVRCLRAESAEIAQFEHSARSEGAMAR
jgi:hypothetical protein